MPTGVYIVVDRAKDMFFVLMEDALGRMHVQVTLKKISFTTRSRSDAAKTR
jgi:hypothetical protein